MSSVLNDVFISSNFFQYFIGNFEPRLPSGRDCSATLA